MHHDVPIDAERVELLPAEWRAVAGHFGELVSQLREAPPIASLEVSAFVVLGLLIDAWSAGDSRSHGELASSAGLSTRTVRRAIVVLESSSLVVQRADDEGAVRAAPGPRLIPILKAFAVVRTPGVWVRSAVPDTVSSALAPSLAVVLSPDTLSAGSAAPPVTLSTSDSVSTSTAPTLVAVSTSPSSPRDAVSVSDSVSNGGERDAEQSEVRDVLPVRLEPLAAQVSQGELATSSWGSLRTSSLAPDIVSEAAGLIKKNKEDLSSFFSTEGGPPAAAVSPVDAATSRRLALQALAELHRRANPGIPLPRTCEAAHVRLVEACAAQGIWDAATLEQAHRDAIAGAFERSTSGAPTPMFIWGKYFFFLKNARIGRALREKPKPAPRRQLHPEEPPAPPDWVARHIRAAGAELDRMPTAPVLRPRRFPSG